MHLFQIDKNNQKDIYHKYLTPHELASISCLSRFFNSLQDEQYWLNRLRIDFNIKLSAFQKCLLNLSVLKEIYHRFYIFKKNSPKIFKWFEDNFLILENLIPPIYAKTINLDEYDKRQPLLKFYLDISAMLGNFSLLNYLIENGIKPDYQTVDAAALSRHAKMIIHLIDNHQALETKNKDFDYFRIVNLVAESGNEPLFNYLIQKSGKLHPQAINFAMRSGNLTFVKNLVEKKILEAEYIFDLPYKMCSEKSLLASAAFSGSCELVKYAMSLYGNKEMDPDDYIFGQLGRFGRLGNFFIAAGYSRNQELIDWVISQDTLWKRLFTVRRTFSIDYVKFSIFNGILLSGDFEFAKTTSLAWTDIFEVGYHTRVDYYWAVCVAGNLPLFLWVMQKLNYNWKPDSHGEQCRILGSTTEIMEWVFDTANGICEEATELNHHYLKYAGDWGIHDLDILSLHLAKLNFVTHPKRGSKQLRMTDDMYNHFTQCSSKLEQLKVYNSMRLQLIEDNMRLPNANMPMPIIYENDLTKSVFSIYLIRENKFIVKIRSWDLARETFYLISSYMSKMKSENKIQYAFTLEGGFDLNDPKTRDYWISVDSIIFKGKLQQVLEILYSGLSLIGENTFNTSKNQIEEISNSQNNDTSTLTSPPKHGF